MHARPHTQFKDKKMFDEQTINSDLSPQLKAEIYKWNARGLLDTTPLLSIAATDGDVEGSFVSVMFQRMFHRMFCRMFRPTAR